MASATGFDFDQNFIRAGLGRDDLFER